MYGGLSAKERLAQLQQKSASKDTPPPKVALKKVGKINGNGAAAAAADKPELKKVETKKEEPKKLVEVKKPEVKEPEKKVEKKEDVKPKEEPKKPEAKEPAKPKEEVKPKEEAAKKPEPAATKPAEEPKKPEVKPEPAKPKEPEAKPAAKPAEPAKTEPAKPTDAKPAPEPAKPAETKPAAEPAKPAETKPAPEPAKKAETKPAPEPAKPADKPAPKPAEAAKPETAKPAEAAKPEAPKPAETKPSAPEPAKVAEVKPADKPAPVAAKEPEKPKEEAKKPEPPKPETKPADKPKVEEKKPAAPAPAAAPKAEPAKTEPPKPAAEPPKPAAAAAAPAKPAETKPEAKPADKPKEEPKKEVAAPAPVPKISKAATDAMIGTIFYFSGMGSLLGSALAEGVYVPERNQRSALDADAVDAARVQAKKREEIVVTARNQAQALSTDFRHLQALLEGVPTFGEAIEMKPVERRAVDEPIHGHVYFQQRAGAGAQVDGDSLDGLVLQQPPSREARRSASATNAQGQPGGVDGGPLAATYTSTVYRSPPVAPQPVTLEVATASPYPGGYSSEPSSSDYNRQQQPHHPPSQQHRPPPQQTVTSSQAWQDRYGPATAAAPADTSRSPRPFSSTGAADRDMGNIDATGIKSWQLSKIRTAEAKGYRLVSDHELQLEPEDPSSFVPYHHHADKSTNLDRQLHSYQQQQQPRGTGYSHEVGGVSPQPYRPASGPGASYPFAPAVESSLPYCDL